MNDLKPCRTIICTVHYFLPGIIHSAGHDTAPPATREYVTGYRGRRLLPQYPFGFNTYADPSAPADSMPEPGRKQQKKLRERYSSHGVTRATHAHETTE
jgi:hypothetical protein